MKSTKSVEPVVAGAPAMEMRSVTRIRSNDFDVFVGLDVAKNSIVATFLDWDGCVESCKLPYDAEHLLKHTQRRYGDRRAVYVYEAGPTGFGLCDALQARGACCLVVSPASVPVARNARVKTNRLDSQQLAIELRKGETKGIRVPRGPYRELRHLSQLRQTRAREITAFKCRIKALLLQEGLRFPEVSVSHPFCAGAIKELQTMECSPAVRFRLNSLLLSLHHCQAEIKATEAEIQAHSARHADLKRHLKHLQSIPGIGLVVASRILARVGDPAELGSSNQLAGFCGLVPCEASTSDRVRRGHITQQGDGILRSLLIEAAWHAIRKEPELAAFYHRIRSRHPQYCANQVAIVAVARKLLMRVYCVLKQNRNYRLKGVASEALQPSTQ
jgi:transposase